MEMRQPTTLSEQLQAVREDRNMLANSLPQLTGWMRESRVKRIAQLDAIISNLLHSQTKFPLMSERPCDGGHLDIFRTIYARGVRMFHVDATCTEDFYHPHLRAWVSPDKFDYSF